MIALNKFVKTYNGMQQRDNSWYASMGVTVGGSEIAAIMGKSSYKTLYDVIMDKICILKGGNPWTGGAEACWWGTLFEDVVSKYLLIDLGCEVVGDDICIQAYKGHRNSPDGYIIGQFALIDGLFHLQTTDSELFDSESIIKRTLLLEFKCPISRKPKMSIPLHYQMQIHSGLAVSPIAELGMFVDAVFRKCRLDQLNTSTDYDREYHKYDKDHWSDANVNAYGIIAVYAPLITAPLHVRYGWQSEKCSINDPDPDMDDADGASDAQKIIKSAASDAQKILDLGALDTKTFNRVLRHINLKRFKTRLGTPCFVDDRGSTIEGEMQVMKDNVPKDYYLMGYFPWKLMEINYIFLERNPNFFEEVGSTIQLVHEIASEAIKYDNPSKYVRQKLVEVAKNKENSETTKNKANANAESDDDSIFDKFTSSCVNTGRVQPFDT